MVRLVAAFLVFVSLCSGQRGSSYERLAAAAKVWAFIKYVHPGVTAPGIDWDRAFTDNTGSILAANSDTQFVAALNGMLSVLHDPQTYALTARAPRAQWQPRLTVTHRSDGVTVLQAAAALRPQPAGSGNLYGQLTGPVVVDLRGPRTPPYLPPEALPILKRPAAPSFATRVHYGYTSPNGSGSGGYNSSWQARDLGSVTIAADPVVPVFLVNSATNIPMLALAIQSSGSGAIVSEDPLASDPVNVSHLIPVMGNVQAMVRTQLLWWTADQTTGVTPNAVLNSTGDQALQTACDMARSGTWPQPAQRPAINLPPAGYAENTYTDTPYPALGYRLLAAARIWGVFHYFHPYGYLYGEDWDQVLTDYLPRMAAAENEQDYNLAVASMVTHVHDSHCFMYSNALNGYFGVAIPPVEVRWIENQPVVTRLLDNTLTAQVHVGDIVTAIDGQPVQNRIDALSPYIPASTPQALNMRIMEVLLAGPSNSAVNVTLETADGSSRQVPMTRTTSQSAYYPYRTGPVYYLIDGQTGYVDLARLTYDQVDSMFDTFRNTSGFVMDRRGYPNGTAWSIAPRLCGQTPVYALFHVNQVSGSPDASGNFIGSQMFTQSVLTTNEWIYHGRTDMLIDDRAISQAEYSGMMFKTANGTRFVGSPTDGADGDVSFFYAPGNIMIYFTGDDVRWGDGSQQQRIGLIPDIAIAPTIEGIRAGRDEVLQRAVADLEGH